jgi:hypothetical protein
MIPRRLDWRARSSHSGANVKLFSTVSRDRQDQALLGGIDKGSYLMAVIASR